MLKTDLSWHIVCGSMEIEELSFANHIRQWMPKNDRHSLFMTMKYPNETFYKGSWGPELLHFVDEGIHIGKVGKVYCTYERYVKIAQWFLLSMYKP